MKTFAVIGLGRFGAAVAQELSALGHEVLALDADSRAVDAVADRVTHAAICDAREVRLMESLGVKECDCAVVAVGSDVGTSALVTLNLKELGVSFVVAKAQSHVHRKVLEKIGADLVVFPEYEMGVRLAQSMTRTNVLTFIELSSEYGLVEINAPKRWVGKSLRELDVRVKYGVNVIAVRTGGAENMNVTPGGDYRFGAKDIVVAIGSAADLERLRTL